MDAMKLIIAEELRERLAEAETNRMLRLVSVDYDAPVPIGWPTRARRRLGDTLVHAGEALRRSSEEHPLNRAA